MSLITIYTQNQSDAIHSIQKSCSYKRHAARKCRLTFIFGTRAFVEESFRHKMYSFYFSSKVPGSTLHGYLSKILARYCQELQEVMVRSCQESQVPKKNFIALSYLARKKLKGSQQKSTFLQIYIVRH